MTDLQKMEIATTDRTQFILITKQVEELVEKSGIQTGMVFIITNHTTSGITVNEGLECL